MEERTVRDALLFGPRYPCIEMRIEMDDRDWPVDFFKRPKDRENVGVVSAQAGGGMGSGKIREVKRAR